MTIEVDLRDSPPGPRVFYGEDDSTQAVLDSLPKGWDVDFTNSFRLRRGYFVAPLVKTGKPTVGT